MVSTLETNGNSLRTHLYGQIVAIVLRWQEMEESMLFSSVTKRIKWGSIYLVTSRVIEEKQKATADRLSVSDFVGQISNFSPLTSSGVDEWKSVERITGIEICECILCMLLWLCSWEIVSLCLNFEVLTATSSIARDAT